MQSEDKRKLEDKTANTSGYKWDLEEDTIGFTKDISLISKKRGKSQNRKLEDAYKNPSMIARRRLSVLSASIISADGILLAPLQVGTKLLLSRAVQLLPGHHEFWRKPPMEVDIEFVQDCLKYIDSVKAYQKIKPIHRKLIGIGEKLQEVLIFHDGCSINAGAFIYLVTKNTENEEMKMRICRAGSKTQDASIAVIEMISRSYSIVLL